MAWRKNIAGKQEHDQETVCREWRTGPTLTKTVRTRTCSRDRIEAHWEQAQPRTVLSVHQPDSN
jgi:hypothetical protein